MMTSQTHSKSVKKTSIGWIPKEWPVIQLGSATAKIGSGITPKGGESAYLSNGIPLIRSQNVLWGKLDLGGVAFISEVQHESMSGTKVQYRDVFLNITGASIGRSCVFEEKGQEANVNQHVCIIRPNDTLDPSYLCALLLSSIGQKQIDSYQGGGNREGLNFEQIRNFLVPFPPLPEQQKIAAILSTWDRALEKTEALIEAKKRLKRGLIQILLSGRKRFFSDRSISWEQIEFFEIAERRSEKKVLTDQGIHVIELENIGPETGNLLGYTTDSTMGSIKSVYKNGDVLFGKLRPYLRKFFLCKTSGLCSTEFWVLSGKNGI